MGKLPFIKDKDLYAAVMGACSYVKATGYFNKATQYYANKYGVDVDDVRYYVRMAQANGQKGKKRGKYHYFAIEYSRGHGERCNYFEKSIAEYAVKRGLSENSVLNTMCANEDFERGYQYYFGRIEQCSTMNEAREMCSKWAADV